MEIAVGAGEVGLGQSPVEAVLGGSALGAVEYYRIGLVDS